MGHPLLKRPDRTQLTRDVCAPAAAGSLEQLEKAWAPCTLARKGEQESRRAEFPESWLSEHSQLLSSFG